MTNKHSVQEIKHFIIQQIVDRPTALSNKQFLYTHLCFKKVTAKIFVCLETYGMAWCPLSQFIYLYFRPLAWHSVLQVNLFCALLKKCWLCQLINLHCMHNNVLLANQIKIP